MENTSDLYSDLQKNYITTDALYIFLHLQSIIQKTKRQQKIQTIFWQDNFIELDSQLTL